MKYLLLIALSLSLYANEIVCQMSTDRYLKQYKLLSFAYERKDVFKIKWHSSTTLSSLERVMVECDLNDKQMEEAVEQRKQLIKIVNTLKGE